MWFNKKGNKKIYAPKDINNILEVALTRRIKDLQSNLDDTLYFNINRISNKPEKIKKLIIAAVRILNEPELRQHFDMQ